MKEGATKEQFMYLMKQFVQRYNEDTEKDDLLYKYCGGTISSYAWDIATDALDIAFSPRDCWISWWVWENEMGKRGMEAGYGGKTKKIKTLEDLWRLING